MQKRFRDLERRKASIEPRRRFIIYCEGRNTEPRYFEALRRSLGKTIVQVETLHAGVPMTIAEEAMARAIKEGITKRRGKKSAAMNARDQVGAVFDRDEHPRVFEAKALCEAHGVGVGYSNPCFEIWLILHQEDFHRDCGRHEAGAHLRRLRPEYDPSGAKTCDFAEMIARVADAESRADIQLQRRAEEGSPHGAPSTTIGRLTREIRAAAIAAGAKL